MNNSNDFKLIKEVLDKYFGFMEELGGHSFSFIRERIPKEMLNLTKTHESDENAFWKPIDSTVTEKEVSDLEKLYKHELPYSFKYFLKYKHFVELNLGQNARFFSVLPGQLKKGYKKRIENYYRDTLKRGFFPFADYGDWGVLCFNTNQNTVSNDYEIVILDHDDEYHEPQFYAESFLSMFELLDQEIEQTIIQVRNQRNKSAE